MTAPQGAPADPSGAGDAPWPSTAGALTAAAALLGFAAFESRTPVARDDFGYLMWGLQTQGAPLAWVYGPEWLSYRRPANAFVWWLSAQSGIDGELARWCLVGLWVACGVGMLALARPSIGAWTTLGLLLLTNQVFVDLLTWRSWLTTAGSLAFLVFALVAMRHRRRPLVIALFGTLSLGFKEMAAVALAGVLATSRHRGVGALLLAGLAVGAATSTEKLGLAHVPENVRYHIDTLALFVPAVPVMIAASFPRLPAWTLGLPMLLVFLPSPVHAAAFVVSAATFLARERRWLPAVTVAFALPLLGSAHARQYMLEGWIILIVAMAARLPAAPVLWVAIAVLGLRPAVDFETHRRQLRSEFEAQRTFLRNFSAPPAEHVYPTAHGWDLDVLYWVRGGATLEASPPEGHQPVQVGPLSGAWADARPTQGKGIK